MNPKIRVDRATLADAAAWVAQAIAKRPNTPGLSGMHLSAVGDRLTLSAFDYEASHTATISAEVVADGDALLPGYMLRDLVGAMKPAEVELVIEDRAAMLSGGRANYRLPTLAIEDWPNLPKPASAVGQVSAEDLAQAVRTVRHAVDDDSPTESVRGVYLTTDGDHLRVVGLRSSAMSTCVIAWSGDALTARIPAANIEAALKGMSDLIGLAESNGQLTIASDERVVTIRCYAGEYARWTQLLRNASPVTARLDAAELVGAVKRVTMTQPRDAAGHAVRVTIRPDEIEVAAADDAVEVLDADVTGIEQLDGEQVVGLGSQVVAGALGGLNGDVVIGVPEKQNLGIEFRMADESSVHYLAPRRLLER
jgi:DNA polymerase III subunit beta